MIYNTFKNVEDTWKLYEDQVKYYSNNVVRDACNYITSVLEYVHCINIREMGFITLLDKDPVLIDGRTSKRLHEMSPDMLFKICAKIRELHLVEEWGDQTQEEES